jgi:hypothetical protein
MVAGMLATNCLHCGNAMSAFARACGHCGASNPKRTTAIALAGAVVALIAALGIAAFVFAWQRTGTKDNFAWLAKAMEDCDAEAAKTPTTLHFLVVPMASKPADDAEWRAKSRNDIGNAILLVGEQTLDGLRSGQLKISSEPYDFRMRDDSTNDIYQWSSSTGVKKFLTPNAQAIEQFKLQFKTAKKTGDAWGATFVNQAGTCYWVNAIIGN